MSTVVWIAEWVALVLLFWTACSLTVAGLYVAAVEFLTWRARHRAGVWGRGWSDL